MTSVSSAQATHPAIATGQVTRERMRRFRTAIGNRVLLPFIGVLLVGAAWEATVVFYRLPVIVLPSPWVVLTTLVALVQTAAFWRDVGVSLYEFAGGYLSGLVLGIAVGMAMGESRRVRMTINP